MDGVQWSLTCAPELLYLMYSMNKRELRKARQAMGLTQAGLAQRLGMTSTSVARMERGEQKIMLVTELAVRYLLVMDKPKRKGGNQK